MVSENTYARASEDFEFKKLESIQVKGKEKPVQAYEVKGIRREKKGKKRELQQDVNKGNSVE